MKKSLFSLAIACALVVLTMGPAKAGVTPITTPGSGAANGTLQFTFVYKASGVEQPLAQAYVYLRDASQLPPMEKYFSPADYIYGPTDMNGQLSVNVPAGKYFLRITRRAPLTNTSPQPLGPPEPGDYSWSPIIPVTISANTVTDLGTQIAQAFGTPLIDITGYVEDTTGAGVPGRYVRAQTQLCSMDYANCGPVKLLATARTDANGKYTLLLNEPGTYFIIESKTLGDQDPSQSAPGNVTSNGEHVGKLALFAGEVATAPPIILSSQTAN